MGGGRNDGGGLRMESTRRGDPGPRVCYGVGGGTRGTVWRGGGDHSARSAITSLYSTPPPHTGDPSGVHPSSPKALKKDVGGGGVTTGTPPHPFRALRGSQSSVASSQRSPQPPRPPPGLCLRRCCAPSLCRPCGGGPPAATNASADTEVTGVEPPPPGSAGRAAQRDPPGANVGQLSPPPHPPLTPP